MDCVRVVAEVVVGMALQRLNLAANGGDVLQVGVYGLGCVRWRRKFGQLAKVGSTSMKDGLYDWEAEAVHG